MKYIPMSASCERIIHHFARACQLEDDDQRVAGHLVAALLAEESLGGTCLTAVASNAGTSASEYLASVVNNFNRAANMEAIVSSGFSDTDGLYMHGRLRPDHGFWQLKSKLPWLQLIIDRATRIVRRSHEADEVSSEHLLQAMLEVDGIVKEQLLHVGITSDAIRCHLFPESYELAEPLPIDFQLDDDFPPLNVSENVGEPVAADSNSQPNSPEGNVTDENSTPERDSRVLAILDANLNRAREGLRVLEDYARFVCRNASATRQLKQLRHDLVAAETALRTSAANILNHRNTTADVGTQITTSGERQRENLRDVVTANSRRVQESLRSLEEFGKVIAPDFSATIKQLRYQTYTLEQTLTAPQTVTATLPNSAILQGDAFISGMRRQLLEAASLYVLITEQHCQLPWQQVVEAALQAGADVLQLREKNLSETELIRRAQWMASACKAANALFILNDRADLARQCQADGVHIGQDDMSVADARAFLDPDQLLGVSTHNVPQLLAACVDGIDYLGVGPVFVSQTKQFDGFPGTNFVTAASTTADRPWFAIGGINLSNITAVMASGARRVAVSQAIIGSPDPQAATVELKAMIHPVALRH